MLLGHHDTKTPAQVVHACGDPERGPVGGRVFVWLQFVNDIVMSNEVDVFSGSKHESDAKEFETRSVTVYARKLALRDRRACVMLAEAKLPLRSEVQ
jgi:hypothetical protein